jgi:hypothetical protein
MAIIAQIMVPNTNNMSNVASILFFNPNCRGVKAALKTRFKAKGSATSGGSCFCQAIIKTLPKEKAISTYSIDQTGPKSHEGGAQDGLVKCEYHVYVFIGQC